VSLTGLLLGGTMALSAAVVLAARSNTLTTWLVVVGLVSALAFLVSAVLGALSNGATTDTISLVGFVLWLAWILGVSQRQRVGRTVGRRWRSPDSAGLLADCLRTAEREG
jgi:hypothetical protein